MLVRKLKKTNLDKRKIDYKKYTWYNYCVVFFSKKHIRIKEIKGNYKAVI